MPRYYTRASKLTGLAQIAAEQGAALPPIMREAGIEPEVLGRPEVLIDYLGFCELLHRCALAWDMPDIGLRMVKYQRIDVLGPVALLIRMERTARGALRAVTENIIIHANGTAIVLEEHGDTATVVLGMREGVPGGRENSELILGQTKLVIDEIIDVPVQLVEVSMTHDKGASARAVAAHFGCPIRYGAERNGVSFDRALLDRPVERSDHAYHDLIRRYVTDQRSALQGAALEDVRAEIARQMELGHCTLATVAQKLRMPPRSLQRRLQAEGMSFRDLVDEWRRARGLSLVANTRLPLSEVSEALGYAEQSVFTKAFRRWYGGTPLSFRAQDVALAS
jgi:AraC-like DNA-binding protein